MAIKKKVIDKEALRAELVAALRVELEAAVRAQRATVEGATHPEAKPENDKDTRALEQSYLARGQAVRVEELTRDLADTERMNIRAWSASDAVAIGAVVTIEDDDETKVLYVAPAGGGTMLAKQTIQVVTPRSPLGAILMGRFEGDEVEIRLAGKARSYELASVR